MPYPAQVQREALVERARELIEENGLDQLTLAGLAASFNIAAPSLYHHFRNKTALLRAVHAATQQALVDAMREATRQGQPAERLHAMFVSYRAFARQNPATYGLLYTNTLPDLRDPEAAEQLALPLQAMMAELVGEARSLAALRGAWALVHGFVMLELSGQFQRAGDLDAAFAEAVEAYIRGLAAR